MQNQRGHPPSRQLAEKVAQAEALVLSCFALSSSATQGRQSLAQLIFLALLAARILRHTLGCGAGKASLRPLRRRRRTRTRLAALRLRYNLFGGGFLLLCGGIGCYPAFAARFREPASVSRGGRVAPAHRRLGAAHAAHPHLFCSTSLANPLALPRRRLGSATPGTHATQVPKGATGGAHLTGRHTSRGGGGRERRQAVHERPRKALGQGWRNGRKVPRGGHKVYCARLGHHQEKGERGEEGELETALKQRWNSLETALKQR